MNFTKPPLSVAEQILKWESRELIINDKASAIQYLSNISFYRFRAYTYPFQSNNLSNQPFAGLVTFEQVLGHYNFDRELRLVVFDAIERIEVALRTQIIYQYAMTYGSHWPLNSLLYKDVTLFRRDLQMLQKEVGRSTEVFIKHYKQTYTSPAEPPAWMSLEVTSIGLLSKLFENLLVSPEKKAIARHFGLGSPDLLASWMHAFSNIRNICAHHGRLWNRVLTKSPTLPKSPLIQPWLKNTNVASNKIYISLCCMLYILQQISPNHTIKQRLKNLLITYADIKSAQMGFPNDWQEEALWN